MTRPLDIDLADQPTRAQPKLTELALLIRKITSMGLRVSVPGRVVMYNSATQIANVQVEILTVKPDPITGLDVPFPPLVISNVPVVFPHNGTNAGLTFALVPGVTTGELRFMDRAIGRWLTTGAPSDPGKPGAHKFEDAIFVPGLHPTTQPIAQAADPSTVLDSLTTIKLGLAATNPILKGTPLATAFTTYTTAIAIAGATWAAIVPPTAASNGAFISALITATATLATSIATWASTKSFTE